MEPRPLTGDEASNSAACSWSGSYTRHWMMHCGACSPSPNWPRHFPMGASAGRHLPGSLMMGRLEVDNYIAERAMRCIALGRKNWIFAGSKAGGEQATAIYTGIETAKLNGLEPQPISQTSSPRSLVAGPHHAGTNSYRGIGKYNKTTTSSPHNRCGLQTTLTTFRYEDDLEEW